jgi:hypothetical protein
MFSARRLDDIIIRPMRVLVVVGALIAFCAVGLAQNGCYTLVNATNHEVAVNYEVPGGVVGTPFVTGQRLSAGSQIKYCAVLYSVTAIIGTPDTVWEGNRRMIMGPGGLPAGIYRMITAGSSQPPVGGATQDRLGVPPYHHVAASVAEEKQTPPSSGFAAVDISGIPYVWAYRVSDGTVAIHEITPGVGNGFTQKNLYKWDTGFSSFATFSTGGTPYVWAYRTSDGRVCIHQISPGVGNEFTQKNLYKWDTGFSSFATFSIGGTAHVWAYRTSDGTIAIHEMTPGVGNGFTQSNLFKWDTGFSSFETFSIAGTPYVWAYRTSDGRVCIHQITPGVGNGFTQKNLYNWDTGF